MSFKLVIIFIVSLYTAIFGKSVRIIGGKDANTKDFPYSVSLRAATTKYHFCGGSIISRLHILTAAHCLTKYDLKDIQIYTGIVKDVESPENIFSIISYKSDSRFTEKFVKESMLQHDIAVATLDKCIEFNEYHNKVKLPTSNIVTNELVLLNGWGTTTVNSRKYSRTLQKAIFRIINKDQCEKMFEFRIHDEQLCAFAGFGKGACLGDSGSGLIYKEEIVGVASFVIPCATGVPDIYTRVYSYLDFITSIIDDKNLSFKCSNT
ncbi:PREDICTED: chymotrypsin-2-like [Ceratosolen solmsi marchali]|uniref:Chymotrypsin-2-like n=1 Tax=Ceratosolen solmsi marchali TaxID=326594 RepID=A0AAJ7E1Y4_9HYME|nr:PREDICTED: chymotrypsin-2-like [Ceratosolen solmsi marchali]